MKAVESPAHQKLSRLNGRDEMNLAEFPITLLTDRAPTKQKTLVFRDGEQTLTVTSSDKYGLPTALDADVIVALIHLTKQANDFLDPTVEFTRYGLIRLLGWPLKGSSYQRLSQSLKCWTGVTLNYEKAWWDNKSKRKIDATFHILETVIISDSSPTADDEQDAMSREQSKSSFTWNKRFFQSCRADNLKKLDLEIYFSLASSISKRIYRFLDKRFYHRPNWTFDLHEFAYDHVGMGRNYSDNGKLKEKLAPAIKELEEIGYLEPMSSKERYTQVRRGQWTITVIRKLDSETVKELEAPDESVGLEKELRDRGVTAPKAKLIVAGFSAKQITLQIEHADFLQEHLPGKIKNLGGWLRQAIVEEFPTPPGFVSKAEKARRAELLMEQRRADSEMARRHAEAAALTKATEGRITAHLASLSMAEVEELDRAILADPETKSQYDKQLISLRQFPGLQRRYFEILRRNQIRARLNLPGPPEE